MSHLDDLVGLARAERTFDADRAAGLRSGTLVRAKQRARRRLLVRRAGAAIIAGAFVGLILLRGASAPGAPSSEGIGAASVELRPEHDSTSSVASAGSREGEAFAERSAAAHDAELAAIAIGDGGYARD